MYSKINKKLILFGEDMKNRFLIVVKEKRRWETYLNQ